MTADKKYIPRLKEKYQKEIIPALMKKFNYKNIMQVPKLEKIMVHVTLGEAVQNIKLLDAAEKQIALITGQKPFITKAKRALAAFKLKKGMPIGCKVTLRRDRMYEFLDRLISLALPRIRDFRGLSSKSFDGRGNYSFGIKEQFIFPEIDYDRVEMIHGLDITICTTAKSDEEALSLLKEFGMPFK
uniref:Large ribosomal subunit protein uL5 n=1 Tax=Thermodesulfovibrio aggregans TaxID=86166 RepID=A0A7C4EKV8_9BACT